MIDNTHSERGWQWTGKIIEKTVSSLTSIYFSEMRMLNPSTWCSQDFTQNHHLYWGKLYRPSEVEPQWRTPSKEDVDMAISVIGLAVEAVGKIETLVKEEGRYADKEWTNEFCRAVNVVDKVLRGTYNLVAELEDQKIGGEKAPS